MHSNLQNNPNKKFQAGGHTPGVLVLDLHLLLNTHGTNIQFKCANTMNYSIDFSLKTFSLNSGFAHVSAVHDIIELVPCQVVKCFLKMNCPL